MVKLKLLWNIANTFVAGAWSLTIIELLTVFNRDTFDWIDDSIKTLFALGGLFYLTVIKIPRDYRNGKLDRKNKKLENEHLELENQKLKDDIKKNE